LALSLRPYLCAAALALSAIAAPAFAATEAAPAQGASTNTACFTTRDWEGWKSPSPTVVYLRIRMNDVYRLDLAAPVGDLDAGDVHLFSEVRGSDWICSPLDLDLALADDHGIMREHLFVKAITKLTPDEVKAIPAKFRP
jgi:hypothetical protein